MGIHVGSSKKNTYDRAISSSHDVDFEGTKPNSLSHFSPLPLVHSFDPLLNSNPLLHTLSQEWRRGVKNNGTHPIWALQQCPPFNSAGCRIWTFPTPVVLNPGPGEQQGMLTRCYSAVHWSMKAVDYTVNSPHLVLELVANFRVKTKASTPCGSPGPGLRTAALHLVKCTYSPYTRGVKLNSQGAAASAGFCGFLSIKCQLKPREQGVWIL